MKDKELRDFIQIANDALKADTIFLPEYSNEKFKDIDIISTQHPEIDSAIGIGGLPRGRVVEIMGMEQSGKTTLALHVIAEAQKNGLRAGLIDAEHAIDRSRAEKIGVNFADLPISQPDSAEQALELLDLMVHSKLFGVIVIDSVAALSPLAEIEGTMSDSTIGLQARLMSKVLRKLTAPIHKYNVLVIFINQLRDKIGGFSPIPMRVGCVHPDTLVELVLD